MRKNYIALAAVAALALASCVNEMPENGNENIEVKENALAFSVGGSLKTRGVEAEAPATTTTYLLGEPVDGEQFYLQETLTMLDGAYAETPATRGTPAYTSNVGSLYGSFNAIAYPLASISSDTQPAIADGAFTFNGNYWQREFDSDPLGSNTYYMFMRMPGTQTGVSNLSYAYESGKASISFDYSSPATAAEQKDILFAGRTIQKSDFAPTAPVLFYHTLSGVKFSTANHISGAAEGTSTFIKKIEFVGLKGKGKCTVYPISGKYNDDATYDSANPNVVSWSFDEESSDEEEGGATTTTSFYQEFTTANHQANPYSGHYDYNNGGSNDGYFPDSFYANDKANEAVLGEHRSTDWNINDGDASLTFWFIPQEITEEVKMIVTFYIQAGGKTCEDITREINFGEQLEGLNWKAGELRTYVLKANEVAVTVEDTMTDEDTKQMVQIRNTGNVPEYIRATVVANWCAYYDPDSEQYVYTGSTARDGQIAYVEDKKDNYENVAVYGFMDATGDDYVYPWNLAAETNEITSGVTKYGQFSTATTIVTRNDDGTTTVSVSDIEPDAFPGPSWEKGNDGYYYYTKFIGVDEAATQPFFYEYVVNTVPDVYLLSKALTRYQVDVHLVMDVVVQAVLAPNASNTDPSATTEDKTACDTAWESALGYRPLGTTK